MRILKNLWILFHLKIYSKLFDKRYKQWNAAFDAGYAAALNKSIIVIHSEDHQHALKEVDAAASAVASDQQQVVRILKYVIEGTL